MAFYISDFPIYFTTNLLTEIYLIPDCHQLNDDIVTTDETANVHTRRKRNAPSSNTNGYTMKVLVAVDNKMMEYHKENSNDLTEYILTLMSIVSKIFYK